MKKITIVLSTEVEKSAQKQISLAALRSAYSADSSFVVDLLRRMEAAAKAGSYTT